MGIVFDTYAWVEYFKGTEKGRVVGKYLMENKIFTPSTVLLELSYKAESEGWSFDELLRFVKHNSKIVGINESFVLRFGKLYNKIKRKVKDIGFADTIVLNIAIMSDSKVLTGDKHFSKLDNVIML